MTGRLALSGEAFCVLDLKVAPPISTGPAPQGEARLIAVLGGQCRGALEGEILSGGADWQRLLTTGQIEIDARYLLRTNDGDIVEITTRGLRLANETGVYFRTDVRFATAAPRLAFLNSTLGVCKGERTDGGVRLQVFLID